MGYQTGLYACFEDADTLPPLDRQQLVELSSERLVCPKDEIILREGEPAHGLFVVERGLCYTQRFLEDGTRQIIDVHFPGEIIGLDQLSQPLHLSGLAAMTDTALFMYNKLSVMHLFTGSPALARLLLNMVSRGQAIMTERIVGLARHGALRRIAHFLLEILHRGGYANPIGVRALRKIPADQADQANRGLQSPLTFRIPHNVIADTLGLSIVHVSRVLRQLREQDMISTQNQGITLMDVDGLRDIAGVDPAARWRTVAG
ncbi:Crp/Fnr family transcriptional regulator [Marinobacter sp.]|uniref:Crp/Fnr family transcriptional regulator n=1 Tax=Marinobacter sp. TaxID=50741 RepID=UPI00356B398F